MGADAADIPAMFHNTPALLYRTKADGTIVAANEAAVEIFGCEGLNDFIGRNATDWYDDPAMRDEALRAGEHDDVVSSVLRLRRFDGSPFWALDRSRMVRSEDGHVAYMDGCLIDITERVNQELALHVSERLYRELIDNASDVIYTFDREGDFMSVNRRAAEVFGHSERDLMEMSALDVVDPAWHDKARELTLEHTGREMGEHEAYEILCRHKDGHAVWLEITSRAIKERGRTVGVQCIARDVTAKRRRRAEEALFHGLARSLNDAEDMESALRELLRLLGEATGWPYGEAWLPDRDGVYRRSPAWYGADQRLGKLDHLSRNLDFRAGEGMPGQAVRAKEPVWQANLAEDAGFVRTAAASSFGLTAGVAIPVVLHGAVPAVLVFMMPEERIDREGMTDIAVSAAGQLGMVMQRRLLQEELEASSVLMEAQIEGSVEAILVVSADGEILNANARFLQLAGRQDAGPRGLEKARKDPAFLEVVEDLYTKQGRKAAGEIEHARRLLRRRSVPVRTPEGEVIGRVWYFDDIGEAEPEDEPLP